MAGLAGQVTSLSEDGAAGLLCLILAFRAWARSMFDIPCLLRLQKNVNCCEIAVAMPWLCSQETSRARQVCR